MNIILIFFIAISLSMDAFSLALAYGTLSLNKKEIKILSIIVGIYHFIMPILGMMIGSYVTKLIHIGGDIVVLITFSIIGIEMIMDGIKNNVDVKKMRIGEMIVFGFGVSIDSFSVGIGIKNISDNFLLCSIIFSIISVIFTYIGLILGKKLNILIGKIATIMGGIALLILGIIYSL